MNVDEFLNQSEHGIRHVFAGLESYRRLLKSIPKPVFVASVDSSNEAKAQEKLNRWLKDTEEDHRLAKVLSDRYFGLTLSQGILCGALLHHSHSAIQRLSKNHVVPSEFEGTVKPGSPAQKACIGRSVRGVPLGLVVYAGRNQYTHSEDDKFHKATCEVFERLATEHGYSEVRDPAFDLQVRRLQMYSHNIVGLLGWRTYEEYESEIRCLLGPEKQLPLTSRSSSLRPTAYAGPPPRSARWRPLSGVVRRHGSLDERHRGVRRRGEGWPCG